MSTLVMLLNTKVVDIYQCFKQDQRTGYGAEGEVLIRTTNLHVGSNHLYYVIKLGPYTYLALVGRRV